MKNILTVMGTRPEAIKLIPVVLKLMKSRTLRNKICASRQHTSLMDPLFNNPNIRIDYQLKPSKEKAQLSEMAAHLLSQFHDLFKQIRPDLVIVQGDTTTAFVAALAAFYSKIKVAHVEAGLRSNDIYSPWPEEAHRLMIDKITNYYFAPTNKAKNDLIGEGVDQNKIWVVGNTSIDAIRLIAQKNKKISDSTKKCIIVTIHRRENQGQPLINICHALKSIARLYPDVCIKFFLHPNPLVEGPVKELLSNLNNVHLISAAKHEPFLKDLVESTFIITDSGGIQEEATFLGKPTLIARSKTERVELICAGTGVLVGTNRDTMVAECRRLLEDPILLSRMSQPHYPYGDGHASDRIVETLERVL